MLEKSILKVHFSHPHLGFQQFDCIAQQLHSKVIIFHVNVNPSCTKVFGTHTFYEGGGGGVEPTPL